MGQNKRVIAAAQAAAAPTLIEAAKRELAAIPVGEMPPVPDFLRITPEVEAQRIISRAATPVRPMPRFDERPPSREEGEDTKALRRSIEEAAAAKKAKRTPDDTSPTIARPARPSRDGMTSVGDIAASLQITPQEARQTLRQLKEPKPPQGWAYNTPAEVDRIRALIKTALDQPRSPRKTAATPRKTIEELKLDLAELKLHPDMFAAEIVENETEIKRLTKKSKLKLPPPDQTTFSGDPKDKAKWTRYHNKQDAIRESIASKRLTSKPGTSSSLLSTKDASSVGAKKGKTKQLVSRKPVASSKKPKAKKTTRK